MSKKRYLSFLLAVCMLGSLVSVLRIPIQAAPDPVEGDDDPPPEKIYSIAKAQGPLVIQDLNYTEDPVDIPNPDRGFERGNDDAAGNGAYSGTTSGSNKWGYMTVPASTSSILGQPFVMAYEMTPPYYLGPIGSGPEYCNVPVEARIVQFYLVLNEFSSNAWCDSTAGTPSAHTRVGVDGPITEYGLKFIRNQFEFIRSQTNSVAHIRVCYDPKGWNQTVWSANNLKYQDGTTTPVTDLAAHIAKTGAGTWRGSSPIFRKCTVPGYEDLNWVQYHYKQLAPIFKEYSDVIWAFDSGTFGPWGESHSCYEAEVPGNYKIILDSLLEAVPDGKAIMTHVGGFLDWYNRTYNTTYTFGNMETMPAPKRGTPEARFGMFDDSNGYSSDEYSYGDNGSLTEGYRMLAHDPLLPGFNPTGEDPSLRRSGIEPVIGYNDSGTNRLLPIPQTYTDTQWRGVWFADWDRTKFMNFLGKMSVYGGEQIGSEPALISGARNNGGYVPIGSRNSNAFNNVISRFPSMFYEHSVSHWTYMCMEQGRNSFKNRADYKYTKENIEVEITYPWSGQKVQVIYDPVYEDQSALAYYRDIMGFRLVLREAYASQWVDRDGVLEYKGKIQNVGWGDVFNKKDVKILLKNKATGAVSNAVLTDLDPYDWKPAEVGPTESPLDYGAMPDSRATNTAAWRDLEFSISMNNFGNVPAGDYDIYLKINDPKETTANKRSIRFANKGDVWSEELGANLIGSTTVYGESKSPLVPQTLDFTENVGDVPNPDRGFYVTQTYTVPVAGGTPGALSSLSTNITGSSPAVAVNSRIYYLTFDLRNFSSNAPTNGKPAGPWNTGTAVRNYGTTQPLSEAAINYIRSGLGRVRTSEAVCILKFTYDEEGYTYYDSGNFDMVIHDCEPGAGEGRAWYEAMFAAWKLLGITGTTAAVARQFTEFREEYRLTHPPLYTEAGATSDSCGIAGHEEKNWVQYQLWQLGSVFKEYEDCIMAVKGGIFGAWGEMHSSSYARTAEGYNWLINAFLSYMPESRSILAHAGGAMAWQNVEYGADYSFKNLPPVPVRGTPAQRIGMFNDSYSNGMSSEDGSYNDNGSLSEGYALIGTGKIEDYTRDAALTWIRNQNNFYGGETVGANGSTNIYTRFPSVPYEAAYAQSTHLNAEYSSGTYNLWRSFTYNEANMSAPINYPHNGKTVTAVYDPVYSGRNGLEYMRDRLGYRLVLREANASQWVEQNNTLRFEGKIQNVGFGLVVNKKNVAVILKAKNGSGTFSALTKLDARDWKPDLDSRATNTAAWRDLSFAVNMSEFGNVPAGDYSIYLKINDPKETSANRRCIRFANKGDIWDSSLGANLIGSTTVVEPIVEPVISDGTIKVIVDDNMSMQVFRNDGTKTVPVWVPMTQPITNMDASGATAVGGAPWKNGLPWSSAVTTGTTFNAGSAKLLSASSGYVTTGANRLTNGNDTGETLLADDFVLQPKSTKYESGVQTYMGEGNRLTLFSYSGTSKLSRKVVLETSYKVPGAVALSCYYSYNGDEATLTVSKFVESNLKITDVKPTQISTKVEAGLWLLCGSPTSWGSDYVRPVFDTMGTGSIVNFNQTSNSYNSPGSNGNVSKNNWNWGADAGFPLNAFWGTNVGLSIGSLMPSNTYGLELPVRGSGITGNHETAYTWVGWPGKTLTKGVETYIGTNLLAVHSGDQFDGAAMYSKAMNNLSPYVGEGINADADVTRLSSEDGVPDWAYAPSYETWGYGESFSTANTMDLVPELKALGIGSVTLDAGWYNRTNTDGEGIYKPNPSRWTAVATKLAAYFNEPALPCTTADQAVKVVARFIDYFHDNGIKVIAWCMPPNGRTSGTMITAHPNWYARTSTGATMNADGSNFRTLCTGNPEVLNEFTDYFVDIIFKQYGFDGIKGDSFYGVAPCYGADGQGNGHGHDGDIYANIKLYGQFFKNIYDKACVVRGAKDAAGNVIDVQQIPMMKNCMCGQPMSYYIYAGTNRPIPGDNVGSRSNRSLTKFYKGMFGPTSMVDSDHMFLSKLNTTSEGERAGMVDYISYLGIGSAISTKYITAKFNAISGSEMSSSYRMYYPGETNYTTASGNYIYKWGDFVKYFGLYNDLGISRSTERSLYKYGIDYPEGYAFQKNENEFFYSFYSTINTVSNLKSAVTNDPWGSSFYSSNTYNGPVEIRGLTPNTAYTITNVETGKKLSETSDAKGLIKLSSVSFTTGIVYHVSATAVPSISGTIRNSANAIVAGITLTLYDSNGKQVCSPSSTNLNGFYAFPLVDAGKYFLKVEHPSYETSIIPVSVSSLETVKDFVIGAGIADLSINSDYNVYLMSVPLPGNAAFDPKFKINNLSANEKSVSVILATYDISGKLLSHKIFEQNIPGNSAIDFKPALDIDGAESIKFFVWQDGWLPLTAVTALEQIL